MNVREGGRESRLNPELVLQMKSETCAIDNRQLLQRKTRSATLRPMVVEVKRTGSLTATLGTTTSN
jgi:hypothetical protein